MQSSRAEAKKAGEDKYFTGTECRKGHLAPRRVSNGSCIECEKVRGARWYCENTERAKATRARWRIENADKDRADIAKYQKDNAGALAVAAKKWRRENAVKVLLTAKRYRDRHHQKVLDSGKKWRLENRHKVNAKKARRTASKNMATPAWADHKKIALIYAEAARLTRETGVVHHVDHIVPLQSKWVCGLHVENNLQILSAVENQSKGNRCWPDMQTSLVA